MGELRTSGDLVPLKGLSTMKVSRRGAELGGVEGVKGAVDLEGVKGVLTSEELRISKVC